MDPGSDTVDFYCGRGGQQHQVRAFPPRLKAAGSMASDKHLVPDLERVGDCHGTGLVRLLDLVPDLGPHNF